MSLLRSLIAALALVATGRAGLAAEGSIVPLAIADGEHGGGRAHVQARFGNALGPMRLDTGASSTRLRLAPWNAQFPVVGGSRSESASGRLASCEDVEAQNVQLVAEQGNNIGRATYVVTRCEASAGDDLLGLDFFHNARFTLDLDGRRMAFPGAPGGPLAPLRRLGPEGRLVGVEARLGRTRAIGLIDTGRSSPRSTGASSSITERCSSRCGRRRMRKMRAARRSPPSSTSSRRSTSARGACCATFM